MGITTVYCTVTCGCWQMFCMLLPKPWGQLSAVIPNGRAAAFTLDESRFLPNSTVTRFAYEIKPSPFSPPGTALSRIHLSSSPPAHAGPKGIPALSYSKLHHHLFLFPVLILLLCGSQPNSTTGRRAGDSRMTSISYNDGNFYQLIKAEICTPVLFTEG